MSKHGGRAEAARIFFGDHSPLTGARVRGQVWRGLLPRKPDRTAWLLVPEETLRANQEIEERRRPRLAFMPDSGLGRLLLDPRVKRPLRRRIVAAVQAPPSRRRTRLQRSIGAQLAALGVNP